MQAWVKLTRFNDLRTSDLPVTPTACAVSCSFFAALRLSLLALAEEIGCVRRAG